MTTLIKNFFHAYYDQKIKFQSILRSKLNFAMTTLIKNFFHAYYDQKIKF